MSTTSCVLERDERTPLDSEKQLDQVNLGGRRGGKGERGGREKKGERKRVDEGWRKGLVEGE